jgi:hypothetical protein
VFEHAFAESETLRLSNFPDTLLVKIDSGDHAASADATSSSSATAATLTSGRIAITPLMCELLRAHALGKRVSLPRAPYLKQTDPIKQRDCQLRGR